MGSIICKQLETKIKYRCSQCKKLQGNKIFITFQQCPHKFCKKCLSVGDKCPIQQNHKSIIQKGIQLMQDIKQTNEQIKVFCQNHHQMIWRSEQHICSKCHQQSHGFVCKICSSYRCTFCIKNRRFINDHVCPNNHLCDWYNDLQICMWCLKKQNGWQCKQCKFVICSQCSQTGYQKSQCPNGDQLIWVKEKNKCVKCKNNFHGWKCDKCSYHLCTLCSETNFQQLHCPNGHKTQFKLSDVCIRCNIQSKVMNCSKCNFNFCTKCQLFKYSTNKLSSVTAFSDRDYQTRKPQVYFNNLLYKSKQENNNKEILQDLQNQQQQTNIQQNIKKIRAEAKLQQSLKNYTKAIQLYKTCTQIQPKNRQNWQDLAQNYLKINLKQQAIQIYEKLARDMNHLESLKKINRIILQEKDNKIQMIKSIRLDMLKKNCRKILQTQILDIETNFLYGRINSFENKIEQSLKYIQKAQLQQFHIYKQNKNDKNYNKLIQILNQKIKNLRLNKDNIIAIKQLDKIIYIAKQNNKQTKTWEIIKQQIQLNEKKNLQQIDDTIIYDSSAK